MLFNASGCASSGHDHDATHQGMRRAGEWTKECAIHLEVPADVSRRDGE